jgi:hypothetical protein
VAELSGSQECGLESRDLVVLLVVCFDEVAEGKEIRNGIALAPRELANLLTDGERDAFDEIGDQSIVLPEDNSM